MKKFIALLLIGVLTISGCANKQGTSVAPKADTSVQVDDQSNQNIPSKTGSKETDTASQSGEIPIAEGEDVDPTPYEYQVDFDSLDDEELRRYVEDNIYNQLVADLDSDQYIVEGVRSVYISQEYIDELTFNSQSNVFFGYSLEELDEAFQGTRYVFTLGDDGSTIVKEFEKYDDTFEKVMKNVAMGTGVILICVTVSLVTAGAGTPAVSVIFASAAKSGTIFALSSGGLSAVAAGVTTGIETGDMDEAMKAAALAGSESFKWGAFTGVATGGTSKFLELSALSKNGLTMNQVAQIQRDTKYPAEVIKQFHTMEEYEAFKAANLQPVMINGKTALIRADIDLKRIDDLGRTNLQRMKLGLSPLDSNGATYELHHIGQRADATLAILTKAEHDNPVLHGFKTVSEIDRKAFATQRKYFWKTMATVLEVGGF